MATASTEFDKEILNCSICLEQFKNPKYLPCLHTFCEVCLQSYISSDKETKQFKDTFKCPICRITVKPGNVEIPVDKWAENMPNNHLIASLLENFSIGDKSCSRMCDPCKFSGKEDEAKYWCVECVEALCDVCTTCHRNMKVSKNHKLVPMTEVTNDLMKMADIDEPCLEHKGKVFEVYCVEHRQMCCVICLATKHRECRNIKAIDEMAEQIKTGPMVSDMSEMLEEIAAKTTAMVKTKQKNIEKLDRRFDTITSTKAKAVTNAKAKLDQLLLEFKTEVSNTHKSKRQILVDRKDRIESFEKTVVSCYKMIQALSLRGNSKQLFVTIEKVRCQLMGQIEQLKHDLSDDQLVDYSTTMTSVFQKIIELSSLGSLKLSTDPNHSEIESVVSSVEVTCNLQNSGTFLSSDIETIEAVQVVEIRSEGSEFTGGVFLDDGKIIFADGNKKELKVFDSTSGGFANTSNYKLDQSPFDIARSSGDEFYVSFNQSKIVRKYRIGERIEKIKEINVSSRTYGVDVAENRLLISCKSGIEIFDKDDIIIRKVPQVSKSFHTYVTASKVNDNLYYKDSGSIVCCSLEGKEVFRHQNKLLSESVRGIGLDKNQNVYVCYYLLPGSKGSIYLISADGSKGRKLLQDLSGIKEPHAIGFDKRGRRFFVTSHGEEITAKIFDISRTK